VEVDHHTITVLLFNFTIKIGLKSQCKISITSCLNNTKVINILHLTYKFSNWSLFNATPVNV
jgi:hypothetical protein